MIDTLLAITTYNQLEYTKLFVESFRKLENNRCELIVIDDCSTDDTVDWCKTNNINVISKSEGNGLTDSWNIAYKIFKTRIKDNISHLIIANNDILIPNGAINELVDVIETWPSNVVVPLSTTNGVGHNRQQSIDLLYGRQEEFDDPNNYQTIQDMLLSNKEQVTKANNLFMLDPIRMKMFNGFFFMLSSNIIKYERSDGNLFDPKFLMTKNEDEFNWSTLIPNNDFPMLCKTSFVYHFKGISTFKIIKDYGRKSNDLNWLKNRI